MIFFILTVVSNLLNVEDPSSTLFHKYVEFHQREITEQISNQVKTESWIKLPLMTLIDENSSYYRTKDGIYYLDWFYSIEKMSPLENVNEDFYVFNIDGYFQDSGFGKTSTNVYFRDKIIQDADPQTFQPIDGYFSRDHQYVFSGTEKVEGADPETFTPLEIYGRNRGLNKDKNHVYFLTEIIENADPETFTTWEDSGYGKDKNNVFFENNLLKEANPETFEPINTITDYGTDGEHIYFENILISNADPETFEPQESAHCSDFCDFSYAKDKNNIYYQGMVIENGDPETFTRHDPFGREKDKYGYIVLGERASDEYEANIARRIEESKLPPTSQTDNDYTPINKEKVTNDGNTVYYRNTKLNADASSFVKVKQGYEAEFYIDKQQIYLIYDELGYYQFKSIKLFTIQVDDPSSFTRHNNYLTNGKQVYELDILRSDIHAPTFYYINSRIFLDKNYIYLYGRPVLSTKEILQAL